MTDDKQHEYVPPALADVGDVREQLAVMTGEAADLAVLLRVTEARLAVVTAERAQAQVEADARNRACEALYTAYDEMRTERNAALLRVSELVSGLSAARPLAEEAKGWRDRAEAAEAERDAAYREVKAARELYHDARAECAKWESRAKNREAERDAAQQSRKRAVGQSRMWKTAAYLRWVDAESWRARAEVCQEERELSQQLREDDGR